jgi:hypothetical protein
MINLYFSDVEPKDYVKPTPAVYDFAQRSSTSRFAELKKSILSKWNTYHHQRLIEEVEMPESYLLSPIK